MCNAQVVSCRGATIKACAVFAEHPDYNPRATDQKEVAIENMGTPMFMSVILVAPTARRLFLYQPRTGLLQKFETAQEDTDLFHRAFPDEDNNFKTRFLCVEEAEKRRELDYKAHSIPIQRHDQQHDVESIYWIFLWAFTRARPVLSSSPENFVSKRFCETLLESVRDDTTQCPRETWLSPRLLFNLFDPLLCHFEVLFRDMAMYLSIPWHLYSNVMEPDHVHVSFRRLIIAFQREYDKATAMSVLLDTEHPRVTIAQENT